MSNLVEKFSTFLEKLPQVLGGGGGRFFDSHCNVIVVKMECVTTHQSCASSAKLSLSFNAVMH